jgi:hypothetical protein
VIWLSTLACGYDRVFGVCVSFVKRNSSCLAKRKISMQFPFIFFISHLQHLVLLQTPPNLQALIPIPWLFVG